MLNFIKNLINKLFKRNEIIDNDYRNGWLPSPLDFRDIPMGAILDPNKLTPLPENYRIPYVLTIKDQDQKPHCVGYASATVKEEKERREGNLIEFDGDWIYLECKKIDNYNGAGTFYRTGLKILQKVGAKPLQVNFKGDISDFRIGGYVQIPCEFESLKRAIYEFGSLLMGFRWSVKGWRTAYVRPPKPGETIHGHACVGVGFTKDYIIGQNSFGADWGDRGLFYIPKDYSPIESWAIIVDLPNNWKELLTDETIKPKFFFQNNLYAGLRNKEVKTLQDCLKWLGCFSKAQESTGYFGPITLEAVKVFQQRYQINPAAGFVGILTRTKLNELFA